MMNNIDYINKLLEIGDREGATIELKNSLEKNPNDVEALYLLGQALDDLDEKADCFRLIIKYDPSYKDAESQLVKIIKAKALRAANQQPTTMEKLVDVAASSQKIYANQKQSTISKSYLNSNQDAAYNLPLNSPSKIKSINNIPPRYLSAVFGFGAIIGVVFPWYYIGDFSFFSDNEVTANILGLESVIGILTLIAGCAIVAISVFRKTLPLRPSSPISSIIAFGTLVIGIVWSLNLDMSTTNAAGGFNFSMICLGLSFLTGLSINPGSGVPDSSTFISLFILGVFAIVLLVFGVISLPLGMPSIGVAFCPGLISLLGLLAVIRARNK